MSNANTPETADVVLIGAGIMSSTFGTSAQRAGAIAQDRHA